MDENELRIAALELLVMERLALDEPGRLLQLEAAIRAGLALRGEPGDGGEEQTIRLQALQIVDDARRRFDVFSVGVAIPKG